jgi:hypothetical protein
MASPISITPVLSGKDSVKFNKELELNRSNKVSKQERERITNLVRDILVKNKKK